MEKKNFSHSPDFMKMSKTFFILFSSYLLAILFFMGLLPRIISPSNENPFKYSHVVINS